MKRQHSRRICNIVCLVGMYISIFTHSYAAEHIDSEGHPLDFTTFSLEELMNYEITSASKKQEKAFATPAAVYVISQEDIKRSGVTSIPDILRTVPGLNVAQINANQWAITSRGFNDRFSNKLLVLMDGRTVYTPIYSGVYWHIRDTLLEDIERIEVIRGPGAALWGANAVNGIINIITKKAKDTQGGLAMAGGGNHERGQGALRYGGKIGDSAHYRTYVKYTKRSNYDLRSHRDAHDDWEAIRSGFRLDWDATGTDAITLQGDLYDSNGGTREKVVFPYEPYAENRHVDTDDTGWNILGRWDHTFSQSSDMSLQIYYDYSRSVSDYLEHFKHAVRTFDVDFQHRFGLGARHEIIWGLGFRHISTDVSNTSNIIFDPEDRDTRLYSGFVRDEIQLSGESLKLELGAKFEYNTFTHFEVQPNARLMWMPGERKAFWISVSRAVSTPSLVQNDMEAFYTAHLPPGALYSGSPHVLASIRGSGRFDSEELFAYEIGCRFKPTDNLYIDIAAFYNDYDRLLTYESNAPFYHLSFNPRSLFLVNPYETDNKLRGETYGIEVAASWQPLQWWQLRFSYTYLQIQLHDIDSTFVLAEEHEGLAPHNQVTLQSTMELPWNLQLNTFFRYVDRLPGRKVDMFGDKANELISKKAVDSYLEMDVCLRWQPVETLEFYLVGRNLLDSAHSEFRAEAFGVPETEVERSIYGKVVWHF